MTDTLLATLEIIDAHPRGPWTMAFLAGVAVFFTLTSGVFQLTGVCYIWRSTLGRLAASGDRAERQQNDALSGGGYVTGWDRGHGQHGGRRGE
jgi:Na+/alanine symporter